MPSSTDKKMPPVSGFDGLDTMSPTRQVKDAISALEELDEPTPMQQTELDRLRMILPLTTEAGGFQAPKG